MPKLFNYSIMKRTRISSTFLLLIAITVIGCNLKKQEPKLPFPEPQEGDTLNVAQAIEYVKFLGTDVVSKPLFIKGVIASIAQESDLFGHATFDIKDANADNRFTCNQVNYLQDKIFMEDDKLSIGDEIIVYGRLQYFKGQEPQTQGNGLAYIYSHNGLTEPPKTIPEDKLNTITIEQAIAIIDTMTDLYSKQYYQISCEVKQITSTPELLERTGAVNMIITDATGSMTAYQTKNVGNTPFTDLNEVCPKGSGIMVVGKLTKFNTTYEIANGYIKEVYIITPQPSDTTSIDAD